jgi:conjugal transfer mating pair stabilization protein TraG
MDWEVVSYGSGDFLRMIFTAIASIFGNEDYAAAMHTCAILGFFGVLFKTAFDKDVIKNFRWFMGMITFIMLVIVPKTTVIVNDRINPSNSSVVSNVPIGLAATASFFSFTGDWLSRSFETIFSMPNEVRYTSSGFLFANSLYDASTKLNFPDDRTNNNFMEFFSSCVVVDGIGHNRFSWREVMSAPDLVRFFSDEVAEFAASFKYTDSSGSDQILPCRSGFSGSLAPDMLALSDDVMRYGIQGGFISRFNGVSAAEDKLQNDIQGAMSFLTGVSLSPSAFVTQQAIINNMAHGTHRLSQETNAAEFNQYIVSGAELHRLTTYQALAAIASEKMPLLRALFEAFIYAIFPIIVMMAIVFPDKAPFAYLMALVWINLWAPMYAILHFAMSYYSQATMTEIAALHGNGFSIFANTEMSKFNADVVSTTGYLTTALPLLAWMLVSRSGALAASLAGRIMQGYDQSVAQVASEGVKGAGQRLNEKWEVTSTGNIENKSLLNYGGVKTITGSGYGILTQNMSKLFISLQDITSQGQNKQFGVDNAVSHEQSESSQLTSAHSSVLTEDSSVRRTLSNEFGKTQGFSQLETTSKQDSISKVNSLMDAYKIETNNSLTDQAKAVVLGALGLSFGIEGKVSLEKLKSESSQESFSEAESFMKSRQFTEAVSHIAQNTKEMAENLGFKESNVEMQGLNAALHEQKTATSEYAAAVRNTQVARDSLSNIKELRSAFSIDQGQSLVNAAQARGIPIEVFDRILYSAVYGNDAASQQTINELVKDVWTNRQDSQHVPQDPLFSQNNTEAHNQSIYKDDSSSVNALWNKGNTSVSEKNSDNSAKLETGKLDSPHSEVETKVNIEQQKVADEFNKFKNQIDEDGKTREEQVEARINNTNIMLLPALKEKFDNLWK